MPLEKFHDGIHQKGKSKSYDDGLQDAHKLAPAFAQSLITLYTKIKQDHTTRREDDHHRDGHHALYIPSAITPRLFLYIHKSLTSVIVDQASL